MSFAVAGASLLSTVLAAPTGQSSAQYKPSSVSSYSSYSATAAPSSTVIPNVNDGFPMPNDQQLLKIEELAHGTLPNGNPPPTISEEGITNLQFIEFNENFEVAFLSSLIHNITANVPGFQFKDSKQKDFVLEVLIAVLAQEELHAINAEKSLQHFGRDPILPCKYQFPTATFDDAIVLAATFTDVVLGTLQDVIEIFADNNDNALTRGVASVVGQEGEQEGFYRLLQNKNLIPNELPFLTTSTRDLAFSALQAFVVPGSCPNANEIKLDIFAPLTLNTKNIQPVDQTLEFTFDFKDLLKSNLKPSDYASLPNSGSIMQYFNGQSSDYSKFDWSVLTLQYINQQNKPIPEKLQNVKVQGSKVTFNAQFPFVENLLNGLTLAAVTIGSGFDTAVQVSNASLFAPALIEVN